MSRLTVKPQTQRFVAKVLTQGPNPYVDIPESVSQAFAEHMRGGRTNVEGKLNGMSVRGALVLIGIGRTRLFVNGGMRSAAGVVVGDTVSFELRATSFDTVRLPADVSGALRKATGAKTAFDALSPSHVRELVRYIDDARTDQTRRRRIQETIGQTLGIPGRPKRRSSRRPMWKCPNCKNEFVNKNQYHSCGQHSLAALFDGKPDSIQELFDRLRNMMGSCGPVKVLPYRDRVGFMVRVRFAAAVPKRRWLDVGLWLPRRIEHPKFHKIQTINPNANVHLLRLTEVDQLDAQVAAWIRQAYALGCQEPQA